MSKRKRSGRGASPDRAAQPNHEGQPVARATPATCDACGARRDSDLARSKHQEATGHRHWTLIRGVGPPHAPTTYSTR